MLRRETPGSGRCADAKHRNAGYNFREQYAFRGLAGRLCGRHKGQRAYYRQRVSFVLGTDQRYGHLHQRVECLAKDCILQILRDRAASAGADIQ